MECPPGCAETNSEPAVFGSGGVYSGRSGICKAAVHAGLIKEGGVFSVSVESPISSFEGSKQNGIESKSLELPPGDATKTMRLSKISEVCLS